MVALLFFTCYDRIISIHVVRMLWHSRTHNIMWSGGMSLECQMRDMASSANADSHVCGVNRHSVAMWSGYEVCIGCGERMSDQ